MAIDPYATHMAVLAACAMRAEGPVLELGVGFYSTPLLHVICAMRGLRLVSVDKVHAWLERFGRLRGPAHELRIASMPADAPDLAQSAWGLAFVDNAQSERAPWIAALADRADLIVAHDTQVPMSYGYETALAGFRHGYTYRPGREAPGPWTTVVSNRVPLKWLKELLS